jgi:hypothetical protein
MDSKVDRVSSATSLMKSGLWRALAVMAGVAAAGIAFVLVWEAALYPWARSLTGGPTLVGEWQGELTTPTGQHRVVRFVVEPLQAQQRSISLTARGRLCDERGQTHDYEAWGNPGNWRGTTFTLKSRLARDGFSGLRLGQLDGEWDGTDAVRLTTTMRTDGDADRDTLAPVSFTLRRASEKDFAAACARLGSSSKQARRQ